MKKQVIGLCAVALIAVTAVLGASGALNARQNGTQPVQTEAPVQTVEPAQNTPEAVQSEPARPGKKVNMDDTKWADAIEELNDYINDYEMKVFEIAWLTEEEISRFHSDFKVVANFFVQKRKHKNYIPDDPTEIKHVDEVLKLLQVMTRDERYQTIFQEKKGVHSMCDVAERLEKMGMEKGKEEEKIRVYKKLIEKGFSEQEAQEITELPKPLEV